MYSFADGTLTPFQPQAGRVFALGLTYADHIRETGEKGDKPVIFMKSCVPDVTPASVSTPDAAAMVAAIANIDSTLAKWLPGRFSPLPALLDYEVELGMVLLDDCKSGDLATPAGMPRVGFFLANDITARSVQVAGQGSERRLDFWAASKSLPGFLPVANQVWCPATPSADKLPNVTLKTLVNGELRQSAPTSNIIYSPLQMLQLVSQSAPGGRLRAGDIILTGTPAGVAMSVPRWKRLLGSLMPRRTVIEKGIGGSINNPKFLRPGDTLQVSADWLGSFSLSIR